MNTIGIIVIALLLVALSVALHAARRASRRLESTRNHCQALDLALAKQRYEHAAELVRLKSPRYPARFVLEGGMTEEQIERALAGSSGSPVVRAIVAHVGRKLVRTSDLATDAPHELIVTPERVIEGYTAEMRLHDAGGASHLAEFLGELQVLTAAKATEEEKPKTAA